MLRVVAYFTFSALRMLPVSSPEYKLLYFCTIQIVQEFSYTTIDNFLRTSKHVSKVNMIDSKLHLKSLFLVYKTTKPVVKLNPRLFVYVIDLKLPKNPGYIGSLPHKARLCYIGHVEGLSHKSHLSYPSTQSQGTTITYNSSHPICY